MAQKNAVVLLSGGLDSATVLAIAQQQGYRVYALSFDYGQRSQAETVAAKELAVFKAIDICRHSKKGRPKPVPKRASTIKQTPSRPPGQPSN